MAAAFNDGCYPAAEFCEENHIPENAPAMREGSWKDIKYCYSSIQC